MPQAYPVRGYLNTGYDTGNVPADPSILDQYTFKDFDAAFEWQDRQLAKIRLHGNWDDAKQIDYLRVGATTPYSFYAVTGVRMLSANTIEMDLVLDPLSSAGGLSGISVISGWESRSHVSSDNMFENILPEPWAPSNRLFIRSKDIVNGADTHEETVSLVAATVDLSKAVDYAKTLASPSEIQEGKVTYPALPPAPPHETEVGISALTEEGTIAYFNLPNIGLYDLSAKWFVLDLVTGEAKQVTIAENLQSIRELGIEGCIVAAYIIPKELVDITKETQEGSTEITGIISTIKGKSGITYTPNMPYKYKSVKNNKAVCLWNNYTVVSISSNSAGEFQAHDLYSGGTSPDYKLIVDPAPNGTVYLQPTYFEGNPTKYLEHAVAGLPWLNAGFMWQGASGAAITLANAEAKREYNREMALLSMDEIELGAKRNIVSGVLGGAGTAGGMILGATGAMNWSSGAEAGALGLMSGNIGAASAVVSGGLGLTRGVADMSFSAAGSGISAGRTVAGAMYDWGQSTFAAGTAANVVAPVINFPVTVNNAAYFGNAYCIYQTTLTDNDLARFDKFLTMYGYRVDRPLVKEDLSNRTKFNYIKTTECCLTSNNAPKYIIEALQSMFNAGVRIWHVKPSPDAFDDNPVRG